MANLRRQLSSRISRLARKLLNSIGRILVQIPPGERKSGMPHSVEMPAPVNGSTVSDPSISSRSREMPVSRSGAIIYCPLRGRRAARLRSDQEVTMRFLHTMLRVRNLDAALEFYVNLLGLKEV